MATKTKRKEENGTSVRSKVVGVRLDPKLRYLAELAARKQRRSLSSFIEWAVGESLSRIFLTEASGFNRENDLSIADEASQLWDVDDAERFARLAILYEDLLTHDEQLVWKLVKDSGLMWLGGYGRYVNRQVDWDILDREVFPQLRKHWDTFWRIARGELTRDNLPIWEAPKSQKTNFDDSQKTNFDDDIPF